MRSSATPARGTGGGRVKIKMLRLIAAILAVAVAGIWLPQAVVEGAAVAGGGVGSDESDTLPILPQPSASGGNFCQKQCPCLGNAIDCSKKNLKSLFPMPHWVDNLDLASNRLSHDTVSAQLVDLRRLQALNLNNNRLRRIPVLMGVRNLTKLVLSNNEIEIIDMEALATLSSLRFLDLSRNAILEVQTQSFPSRNSLQYLNLNFNKLTTLTKGTFDRLTSVKRLEISGNALEEVQSLTFQNLNQLKSLKLNNNRIPALMDGVFHGLISIGTLELNNNSITSIRKGGFFNLTSLTNLALAHNRIGEIEQSGWEFTPKLISLDLSYNQLETLDRYTFEELSALQTLNLQGNRISAIGEGTFNETRLLETLYLNANRISWTIEDMRGPFMGLNKLTRLYLNANEIKSVSRTAFLGLKSLTLLEISQNNISSIQNNAFKDTPRLKNLIMNSTNLICDCNLVWFYHWIKERREVFQIDAECIYPIWLRNRLIRDLHPSNFSCDDSPKPHLIEEPRAQLGIRGTNVTLVCTATSTAATKMTFKWKQDNLELPSEQFTVQQINNDNGTIGSSELTIPNIQQSGAGKYQCIITNNYGVVYSSKVKVTVGTYPKFRKTPSDVSVEPGKVARLDCAAMGEPKPQISWEKDGGNDFPAAKERRMHVIPNEDAFLILNVQLIDMGVYSCTAENPAGIIRANASVVVFDSPTALRPINSLETPIGKASVIVCRVSISPKPVILWLKDGEPIGLTERHYITGDGQLLVIVDTEIADAGLYECRLANELGTERESTRLIVIDAPEDMHGSVVGDTGTGYVPGVLEDVEIHSKLFSSWLTIAGSLIVCVFVTSLIWMICMYRMEKRIRGGAMRCSGETEFDLATGMEINQPNLIVRSGVGTSTTPAGYFEYLIPMVRNKEITTNVDDDGDSADCGTIGRDHGGFYTAVANTKTRSTELDSDDLDDDLSSKDSGTGGDCASATGSTNAAHRGSQEDLKCLLHSLNRKHTSDVELNHHRQYQLGTRSDASLLPSSQNAHDPDDDPRIEPPPAIPPVNATSTVLMGGPATIQPSIGPACSIEDYIPSTAGLSVSRLPNSQTFPGFTRAPNTLTEASLRTSSLEASADPVIPTAKEQPVPQKQIQVNQLYQLLLENPRLMEKPAKYRTKSMEQCHSMDAVPTSASSGIGTGSSNGSTMNGECTSELRQPTTRTSDTRRKVNR
ncbi:leucine-rich repeats and immunoglobulin-like domains protein 2 [Anopheles nili]|uniref:leucine-rich repeats and immunoglobulin-like domains protein 2 n=1 Tax=Anopheles nili TaxID=185578 RepID=UPI00237A5FE5|nr:leucine-rich repeats and immunoglobulin-like domains protein 2 [Anopheles nili]